MERAVVAPLPEELALVGSDSAAATTAAALSPVPGQPCRTCSGSPCADILVAPIANADRRGSGVCGDSTRADGALVATALAEARDRSVPEKRGPTLQYSLLGQSVMMCQGECTMNNTGWRTWTGAWLAAKYFESRPDIAGRCILDMSCGTGLAGISLALAGHRVVLCDMAANVPTIQDNLARNLPLREEARGHAVDASVVAYNWGSPLPGELRTDFDIIVCADLLYHVWSGRLRTEFTSTLHYLHRGPTGKRAEFLFCGQVRSGRQEQQLFDEITARLGLHMEELPLPQEAPDRLEQGPNARGLIQPGVKYRCVRLFAPSEEAS